MRKLSDLIKESESNKTYKAKVSVIVEITVVASSEGDAGQKIDDEVGKMPGFISHQIDNIEEVSGSSINPDLAIGGSPAENTYGTEHLGDQDVTLGKILDSKEELTVGTEYCIVDLGLNEWNGGYQYAGPRHDTDHVFEDLYAGPGEAGEDIVLTDAELDGMIALKQIALAGPKGESKTNENTALVDNESLAKDPKFLAAVTRATNNGFTVGTPESEHKFVSGNLYWKIDSATFNGNKFVVGDRVAVDYDDVPKTKTYKGKIEWLMVDDMGSVQASISHKGLGRIPVEDLVPATKGNPMVESVSENLYDIEIIENGKDGRRKEFVVSDDDFVKIEDIANAPGFKVYSVDLNDVILPGQDDAKPLSNRKEVVDFISSLNPGCKLDENSDSATIYENAIPGAKVTVVDGAGGEYEVEITEVLNTHSFTALILKVISGSKNTGDSVKVLNNVNTGAKSVFGVIDENVSGTTKVYGVYAGSDDLTFIMEDVNNGDATVSTEVKGFYHGEPDDNNIKQFYGKLKAQYDV